MLILQITAAVLLLVYSVAVIIHNCRSPWLTQGSMQSDCFYCGLIADSVAGGLVLVSLIVGRPFGVHVLLLTLLVCLRAPMLTYRVVPDGKELPVQHRVDGLIRLGLTFSTTSGFLALLDEPEFPRWATNSATCVGVVIALGAFAYGMYDHRAQRELNNRNIKST